MSYAVGSPRPASYRLGLLGPVSRPLGSLQLPLGCLWGAARHPALLSAGPAGPAPRPPSLPARPGPVASPDLVGARAVHGAPSRPAAPRSSGRSPLVPPRGRGPDLRNGGGAEPPPSAPTVAARPRAAAPPPCARPGALPHGASGGGARGAPRVRAGSLRGSAGLCAGAAGPAAQRASAPPRLGLLGNVVPRGLGPSEGARREPATCVRARACGAGRPGACMARAGADAGSLFSTRESQSCVGASGGPKSAAAPQGRVQDTGCTLVSRNVSAPAVPSSQSMVRRVTEADSPVQGHSVKARLGSK